MSNHEISILIVDDSPSNLGVASGFLRELGYKIATANNGKTALSRVERIKPSLILLDVNMPEMNGFEVCQILNGNPEYVDIPIIFLTALTDQDAKEKAFSSGAVDYISKPFQKKELIARVQNHLSISQSKRELERLVQEKSDALDQLRNTQNMLVESEKMASLAKLVSGVAHEMNTPIGNCISTFSAIRDTVATLENSIESGALSKNNMISTLESIRDFTTIGLNNTSKQTRLIDSFRELDAAGAETKVQPVNVGRFLSEGIESVSTTQSIETKFNIECDPTLTVKLNTWIVHDVLQKLVLNTYHHGFSGSNSGQVWLKVRHQNGELEVEYSDDGKGVSAEVEHTLFEPFITTERGQGFVGLGLHVAYILVTQYLKGRIELINSPDGARFNFCFPCEIS
ncbi:putative SENSORY TRANSDUCTION HISTIDINE KINASE (DHKB) [Vibrio nigripulchritudo MADA3029]|uniref:histidine kinase n=2 Tax=Vibrio nigripulchritudo TaxID=28173 RepID=U4K3G1_9VIBR|nr:MULTISPECIES: hybrid sensor histidine kinase/response regulator [Vibrio]EGU61202.1 signal transduction histidine kinase [Vibrio nigripulchritudo ATCC 27043]UAB71512.1 hybrid sensor histidine kinase/response regulator [Vibrio sp. SCSIO 43132]CCN34928.1 putative SENSORY TRANSDUCTION HISTIDINE KINASE (DHKB) [Vibrio nigripulchritudo AM115]CCN39625.1 putative SENSORY TRANSDUCTION HISTIDINE KINASE (DHKB) [Vibrio nigripulchritudo FTn2]CCN46817.1 putative SENSORY TRANSDUCTION HISTIDINE KINASE (DHKB